MKRSELRIVIKDLIAMFPGISCAEICRMLNDKTLIHCVTIYKCKYYLNIRRRNNEPGLLKEPPCEVKYNEVMQVVRELEAKGLITTKREAKTDGRQPRGWDYFKCCYAQR